MFNPSVIEDCKAHAERDYPLEACGVVVEGRYVACQNVAADPERQFKVPKRVLTEYNGTIQAVIHSHPDGPYYPSRSDMQGQIDSQVPWGIVFVHLGTARDPFFWGDSVPIPPLIGRKFQHGVTDCYSLVRDYYRLNNIVSLPEIPREWEWWRQPGFDLYRQNLEPNGFRIINASDVREGDGFLAQIRSKVVNHAGIYEGNGLILHQLGGLSGYSESNPSCREPVHRWQKFIRCWVRYDP